MSTPDVSLAQAFVAARGATATPESLPGLQERLARGLASARSAWPGVELEGPRFVGHLARLLPGEDASNDDVEKLNLADVYLARAAADGLPSALKAFEARFLPEVDAAVARLKLPATGLDEVRQLLRQRMLVGSADAPARLAAYPGTGPLSGWVRAAALWLALDWQRQRSGQTQAEDGDLSMLVAPGDDPELAYLKTTYRAEFNASFSSALAALEPRQRNFLRLKYLDGLSIDQLGALYGVHRSTAARWVVGAQEALLQETRKLLTERLRLTRSQLDSVLRLISSQLDVSLSRLLRSRLD
ncbi:sigma-70 family RNA polymerase sigma factor [Pyxidicoccus xibeiensis]|uniref:sigma-70 family RNA polymerase sigma factor n=1 Tax=Pyxidicoccus xibeiensis TaxID=2906759 RepID=UPI0020A70B9A|nr:sigma-70 family RNA polymerase sigma factor [Pyxidicoccus xibeiensis]MCP3143901.1 sigma-70 family RNA polymerase sigma factor [Pyxidicoccus xibeiensis]